MQFNSFSKSHSKQFVDLRFVFIRVSCTLDAALVNMLLHDLLRFIVDDTS